MNDIRYTWIINTYKSLPYLKLAVKSIRENAYYKNQPILVYCENDPETYEWLKLQFDIETIYETNDIPRGIGGGVNICVERCKTDIFSLIHSDMVISKHYDKPLYDIVVDKCDTPIVAGAWRVEPNLWDQSSRLGTIMAPANADAGLGVYHYDFRWDEFLQYADEIVESGQLNDFRKVEGVSYMMYKKYFIPNDPIYAPSSFEDHDQSVKMQLLSYKFVISGKAVVWHFGSRASIFLGQQDKLTGRSDRQIECERRNFQTWLKVWGEAPQYDSNGFIIVTENMRKMWNDKLKSEVDIMEKGLKVDNDAIVTYKLRLPPRN